MFQAGWRSQSMVRLDLGLRIAVNEYDYVVLANVDNSEPGFKINIVSLSDLEYQLKNVEERDNSYWIEFSSAPTVNGLNPTGRDFKIRETQKPIEVPVVADNPNQVRFIEPVPSNKTPVAPTFIDFAEERLELGYDYGAVGGPAFNTEIVETNDGSTSRNALHHLPLGRWQLGDRLVAESEADKLTEVSYLKSFHSSRQGSYQGFRYKDWNDYQAIHQIIGIGDGVTTQWQLKKAYKAGDAVAYRPIIKPVFGTVVIYANGETTEAASEPGGEGWTVNHSTGVISNSEPLGLGVVLSASFEFDVPVWFETDEISFSMQAYEPETGDSIYRLGSVFVVEGRIPLTLPWAIEPTSEIVEELDLGIIYDTVERLVSPNIRQDLKNGYVRILSKTEDGKLFFDLGDRNYDRSEIEKLLNYFWNAKGKYSEFLFANKGKNYKIRFDTDSFNLKFLAAENEDALFNLSGLKLQLKEKTLYKIPPFVFLKSEPVTIDPNDEGNPTIAASNPSSGSGSSSGSTAGSSSGGGRVSTFSISTYTAGGTNLGYQTKPTEDLSRDYFIVATFWQASALWILLKGDNDYSFENNAGRNRSFLYKGEPQPDKQWLFYRVDTDLYNYSFNTNPLVISKGDRTVIVCLSSRLKVRPNTNGDYSIEESNGLIELEVNNQGAVSLRYISTEENLDTSVAGFERPFFAFENSILLNTSNSRAYESKLVYSGDRFSYYNYENSGDRDYSVGYPLMRGHITSSGAKSQQQLDLQGNSTPGNVYAEYVGLDIYEGTRRFKWQVYYVDGAGTRQDFYTLYTDQAYSTPQIAQTNRDDGSYALSIKYRNAVDPANLKSVVDLFYRPFGTYEWQFAGSMVFPPNGDASRAIYDRYASIGLVWISDRFGNGVFSQYGKSFYYRAGSGFGLNISSLINNNNPIAMCNSPYGFILLTSPRFVTFFSDRTKIYIVQSS